MVMPQRQRFFPASAAVISSPTTAPCILHCWPFVSFRQLPRYFLAAAHGPRRGSSRGYIFLTLPSLLACLPQMYAALLDSQLRLMEGVYANTTAAVRAEGSPTASAAPLTLAFMGASTQVATRGEVIQCEHAG